MHTLKSPRVVYKGALSPTTNEPLVVVLQLPRGAKVRRLLNGYDKNRASSARVLAIESVDGLVQHDRATSRGGFMYKLGRIAKPVGGFDSSDKECSRGIHFYLTRRDALGWVNVSVANGKDKQYLGVSAEFQQLRNALNGLRVAHSVLEGKLIKARAALA